MAITNEQRDQALINATDEVRQKYSSSDTGKTLWSIAEKHSITQDESYSRFAIIVGDAILGLTKTSELPGAFSQNLSLSSANAVKLTSDLIEFLGGETAPDLTIDIAETEAALEAIPKVRTMADDISKARSQEHTYSSTQSAILGESKKIQD